MTVGELIKQRRKEIGLTQKELAARCRIGSSSTICKIESSNEDMTIKKIMEISEALGVSPAYFFESDQNRECTCCVSEEKCDGLKLSRGELVKEIARLLVENVESLSMSEVSDILGMVAGYFSKIPIDTSELPK